MDEKCQLLKQPPCSIFGISHLSVDLAQPLIPYMALLAQLVYIMVNLSCVVMFDIYMSPTE